MNDPHKTPVAEETAKKEGVGTIALKEYRAVRKIVNLSFLLFSLALVLLGVFFQIRGLLFAGLGFFCLSGLFRGRVVLWLQRFF